MRVTAEAVSRAPRSRRLLPECRRQIARAHQAVPGDEQRASHVRGQFGFEFPGLGGRQGRARDASRPVRCRQRLELRPLRVVEGHVQRAGACVGNGTAGAAREPGDQFVVEREAADAEGFERRCMDAFGVRREHAPRRLRRAQAGRAGIDDVHVGTARRQRFGDDTSDDAAADHDDVGHQRRPEGDFPSTQPLLMKRPNPR